MRRNNLSSNTDVGNVNRHRKQRHLPALSNARGSFQDFFKLRNWHSLLRNHGKREVIFLRQAHSYIQA